MKVLLALEQLALFGFSIFLYSFLPYSGWWYVVLFLAPDIGMIGYLISSRVGAITYNATHWQLLAFVLIVFGFFSTYPLIALAGTIMLGHSAFDRILGYGLKYPDSFKRTHLGNL